MDLAGSLGVLLVIIAAISVSLVPVFVKKFFSELNPIVIVWLWEVSSACIMVPIAIWQGIPALDTTFWIAISIRSIADAIASVIYFKAIQLSELSLVMPLLALMSVFSLGTDWLINGVFPSHLGLIGVLCIVVGVYFLGLSEADIKYPLASFVALFKNSGARMMLAVALIWSITSSLHTLAIHHSNPIFYTAIGMLIMGALLTPFVLAKQETRQEIKKLCSIKMLLILLPVGALSGVAAVAQMIAQSIILTVYVITLKQLKIVCTTIGGWWFLGEDIKDRILPILIVLAGVVMIAIVSI